MADNHGTQHQNQQPAGAAPQGSATVHHIHSHTINGSPAPSPAPQPHFIYVGAAPQGVSTPHHDDRAHQPSAGRWQTFLFFVGAFLIILVIIAAIAGFSGNWKPSYDFLFPAGPFTTAKQDLQTVQANLQEAGVAAQNVVVKAKDGNDAAGQLAAMGWQVNVPSGTANPPPVVTVTTAPAPLVIPGTPIPTPALAGARAPAAPAAPSLPITPGTDGPSGFVQVYQH